MKLADQKASNGVIHVLDQVMLPPAGNIVASLSVMTVCVLFVFLYKKNLGAIRFVEVYPRLSSFFHLKF